ncbi:MAG: ribonuclease H-like domain-containing protein [Bacillota bacterium]
MSIFERLNSLKNKRNEAPAKNDTVSPPSAQIPGGREITSPLGTCLLFESCFEGSCYFPWKTEQHITQNLKLIRGIGPVIEERLKREGLNSLEKLLEHPRWGSQALLVKKLIAEREIMKIRSMGASDHELLCFFKPQDIVFLDIESTGLWPGQPLFLVGLLFINGGNMVVQQFFARHYREEKPLLEAVHKVLKPFKVIVTFNGKRFDIPYIEGRSVEHRLFYRYHHFQVDLLYHARRHFSTELPNCRLVTLEENLLEFHREGDIPGYLIPETYHRFVRTRDPELILPVIEHNRLDLVAMARLFHLVEDTISA